MSAPAALAGQVLFLEAQGDCTPLENFVLVTIEFLDPTIETLHLQVSHVARIISIKKKVQESRGLKRCSFFGNGVDGEGELLDTATVQSVGVQDTELTLLCITKCDHDREMLEALYVPLHLKL